MYCYVSNISVYIANTRSSIVSLLRNLMPGGGGRGMEEEPNMQLCLFVTGKKPYCLFVLKKINITRKLDSKKTGRGMHSPLGMQRLIMLLKYQLILSQHEPSGRLCAVIIDNTKLFYSEPLLRLVSNQQYRKENCCSLRHFHPSAAVAYRNHILNLINVK